MEDFLQQFYQETNSTKPNIKLEPTQEANDDKVQIQSNEDFAEKLAKILSQNQQNNNSSPKNSSSSKNSNSRNDNSSPPLPSFADSYAQLLANNALGNSINQQFLANFPTQIQNLAAAAVIAKSNNNNNTANTTTNIDSSQLSNFGNQLSQTINENHSITHKTVDIINTLEIDSSKK